MKNSPRELALDILCRVENGAFANHLLDAHRAALPVRDRDLLQHLVLGTLTWRQKLDFILNIYLPKPVDRQTASLRNILRLGVYQLDHLDRVPAYAIVNESVSLARKIEGASAGRFVNAVLRGVSEKRKPVNFPSARTKPVDHLASTESHPHWMVARWLDRYGFENTQRLCRINNAVPVLTVRTNTLLNAREALRQQLLDEHIDTAEIALHPQMLAIPHPGALFQSHAYHEGLFSVQGVGAALVSDLLIPRAHECILDVCSAPGGKATAMAERMGNSGTIIAIDLYPARLKTVRKNAQRLRITSIRELAADALSLPTNAKFDRILLDVPCSTLGILNHHPDMRWQRQEKDIGDLARQQGGLLAQTATYLKRDGVLVYSTCTLEPEENEHIIESFLESHPHFQLEPARNHLPAAKGDYLQLLPHEYDHDGVFAARLTQRP
jgi:16S rRNA (cytosine967-C5)-methyltransferase